MSEKTCIIISILSAILFYVGLTFDLHGAFACLFAFSFFFFLSASIRNSNGFIWKIKKILGGILFFIGGVNILPHPNKVFVLTVILSGFPLCFDWVVQWIYANKDSAE